MRKTYISHGVSEGGCTRLSTRRDKGAVRGEARLEPRVARGEGRLDLRIKTGRRPCGNPPPDKSNDSSSVSSNMGRSTCG
jgi:hypothetical protein